MTHCGSSESAVPVNRRSRYGLLFQNVAVSPSSSREKALSSLSPTVKMLELPAGHKVQVIPSGCCGMAGSFGYEEEHFALSQQIGELVLFPAVRQTPGDALVAAPGTSCRHQIKDGTGRTALHPAEILRDALIETECS